MPVTERAFDFRLRPVVRFCFYVASFMAAPFFAGFAMIRRSDDGPDIRADLAPMFIDLPDDAKRLDP